MLLSKFVFGSVLAFGAGIFFCVEVSTAKTISISERNNDTINI